MVLRLFNVNHVIVIVASLCLCIFIFFASICFHICQISAPGVRSVCCATCATKNKKKQGRDREADVCFFHKRGWGWRGSHGGRLTLQSAHAQLFSPCDSVSPASCHGWWSSPHYGFWLWQVPKEQKTSFIFRAFLCYTIFPRNCSIVHLVSFIFETVIFNLQSTIYFLGLVIHQYGAALYSPYETHN